MNELPNQQTFAELVKTKFAVLETAEPLELELTEVTEPTVTDRQTHFSLYFSGSGSQPLPQGTYPLRHESAGEFLLFLVPVGRTDGGFLYESVFNLLNEKPE